MATNPLTGLQGFTGNAANDLTDQVVTETDEERKRRLRLQQMTSGLGSALGSLGASTSLFGGYGR